MAILFWLIILLACVYAEIHTQAFVALFIGVGSIISFFLALASVPFAVQAVAFVLISGLTMAGLRPTVVRRFARGPSLDLTVPATSALTNQTGFVEELVGDQGHPGRVKIQGELWRAVCDAPSGLDVGTRVRVTKTFGTTLWVERA